MDPATLVQAPRVMTGREDRGRDGGHRYRLERAERNGNREDRRGGFRREGRQQIERGGGERQAGGGLVPGGEINRFLDRLAVEAGQDESVEGDQFQLPGRQERLQAGAGRWLAGKLGDDWFGNTQLDRERSIGEDPLADGWHIGLEHRPEFGQGVVRKRVQGVTEDGSDGLSSWRHRLLRKSSDRWATSGPR